LCVHGILGDRKFENLINSDGIFVEGYRLPAEPLQFHQHSQDG
jgi:hypothetical protein